MRRIPTLSAAPPVAEPLVRRLSAFARLSDADRDLVAASVSRRERWGQGVEIQSQGESIPKLRVLLSGWACRQRLLPTGRRQIFDFLLPGDLTGFCTRPQPLALVSTATLTPVETAQADTLQLAVRADPEARSPLVQALMIGAVEEEARLLDHVVRLGRLSAFERVAHLLLELHARLQRIGHAQGWRFPLPLTQETLADATGLSLVHINRTLQQLRRERLIDARGGWVTLLEADVLQRSCDYRPFTASDVAGLI